MSKGRPRYDGNEKEEWTSLALPRSTLANIRFLIGGSKVPAYVFLDNLMSNYNDLITENQQLRAKIMGEETVNTILRPLLPPKNTKIFTWLRPRVPGVVQ